jgi:sugar-specific transcriptional regulator TrmB
MTQCEDLFVESLERLGLTKLQSKIYLVAVSLQKTSVSKISAVARIARPDVYRVLPTLEELGLVRRIIGKPTLYEATSLKEGCCSLLSRKKQEYDLVKKSAVHLLESHRNQGLAQESDKCRFELVSSAKQLLERLAVEDSLAQRTIDIMGTWFHVRPLLYGFQQMFPKALKKGVKIRVIIDEPSAKKSGNPIRSPLLEVRTLGKAVPIKTVIYDTERANMYVGAQDDKRGLTPSLWSENPGFVKIVVAFYESVWSQAEPLIL